MVYHENLFEREEISIDDYIEIERNIAHKYMMKENIFRMKKRACDYGSVIIQNKLQLFDFFFYKVDDIFFRDFFQLSTYVISFFVVVFTFN